MKRQEAKVQPAKTAATEAKGRKPLPGDGEVFDPPETEVDDETDAFDELEEETGLDLSDASELDADNVTADEEFDRVMQAPD
ncbi:hypothetical protein [Variovorax sp. OV329]|uniref:hypothetical protein n=1 Tax=Variovorax sp. OV329 TaxID=1882825 RepID=UPI0008E94D7D|nr:hypothetical protein [Variovorax sp. OV329]SFM21624.1 hypothetical protein SAMN05444747_103376 [Variovorax sp. OV329]